MLGATGMRVGELINLKIENIHNKTVDLYAKGGKYRRVYIPSKLSEEIIKWQAAEKRNIGYLFLNRFGQQLTTKGIAIQLKTYASEYQINTKAVHPHAFRHLFAKSFLSRCPDISLLADLLGHENISTTRLYLRRSCQEQQELIDKIVKW